jgi:hypothetical protein
MVVVKLQVGVEGIVMSFLSKMRFFSCVARLAVGYGVLVGGGVAVDWI